MKFSPLCSELCQFQDWWCSLWMRAEALWMALTASLAELNHLKPRVGKNVIMGLEIPFFAGLFTSFWNHGKWKYEMRQVHAFYSNTWWLNNVERQQMGSECCMFPEDSSLSAKVYISKNLYWYSQFSLVLMVNFHKYVFGVQFHSKRCILWLNC